MNNTSHTVFESPLKNRDWFWWGLIALLTLIVSVFHFTTPPEEGHIHLILMQFYLVPILIGALQFGVAGGLGLAVVISVIVAPHIIFQWVGGAQHNALGYLQIAFFNIIGYLTGLKAQLERGARRRLTRTAEELTATLERLEQQSSDLSEMEEQLRQAERLSVIGELMASLAHELRNPLASIRGSVDILMRNRKLPSPGIGNGEKGETDEFFQILVSETERMSAVVENYLALARRGQTLEIEYDALEIVRAAVVILASRGRRDRVEVKVEAIDERVPLHGDPNDLRQILVNLLLNAVQASPEDSTVTLSTFIKAQDLVITVEDEGPGIPKGHEKTIFQTFYSTKVEGTGLGLSIVKRIAESRHWKIGAENSINASGATFVLRIPLAGGDAATSEERETHGG